MENQHRQIRGYRELTQGEIDLMNEVKRQGEALGALIERCATSDRDASTTSPLRYDPSVISEAGRWRSIARTQLQQGLMALTRSVAKPEFF